MRPVERKEWNKFLTGFGHQHRDWIVLVERWPSAGAAAPAVKRRLEGARLSDTAGGQAVFVDLESGRERATAVVQSPVNILVDVAADGADRGIVIEGTSDTLRLTFQTPAIPEEVDGLFSGDHH